MDDGRVLGPRRNGAPRPAGYRTRRSAAPRHACGQYGTGAVARSSSAPLEQRPDGVALAPDRHRGRDPGPHELQARHGQLVAHPRDRGAGWVARRSRFARPPPLATRGSSRGRARADQRPQRHARARRDRTRHRDLIDGACRRPPAAEHRVRDRVRERIRPSLRTRRRANSSAAGSRERGHGPAARARVAHRSALARRHVR